MEVDLRSPETAGMGIKVKGHDLPKTVDVDPANS